MIAREGWLPVLLTGGTAALITVTAEPIWSVPVWVLLTALIVVFRETSRAVPSVPLAVVSPVDAKITYAGPGHDPWLKRQAMTVRLNVPFPGVTGLLSPTEGKVVDFFTNFGAADAPSDSPTAYALWVRTDEDDDVAVCVSTHRHSRFKSLSAPGERVGQGQRNGFVYFATEVTLYLPLNTHTEVASGEPVRAGSSIVATLVHDEPGPAGHVG